MTTSVLVPNGSACALDRVPVVAFAAFRSLVLEKVAGGGHLAALFALPRHDSMRLLAVLSCPDEGGLALAMTTVGDSYPSLTPECTEAHLFEREIAETWGIVPVGHPWLKPVRFLPLDEDRRRRLPSSFAAAAPAVTEFFQVEGDEVHEVAVGPVHAGVIEPGHFRFQCHGERVLHLEIALGFQHRGIEAALRGGPDSRTRHFLETAAGDTTCGHGLAYAMNIEALAGLEVAPEADRVRAIGLELERIANHVGDLGALAGDVGFLPTASYCGRLRGDILNLTAQVCGNRFGRGLVLPGGVGYGIDAGLAATLRERLGTAMRDIDGALALLFDRPGILARLEDLGVVNRRTADRLGLVGPAARASGLEVDVRLDLPFGVYSAESFVLPLGRRGDVMDRARQRRAEIGVSAGLVDGWLAEACDARPVAAQAVPVLRPEAVAVSLTEGWRGQICQVAVTGADGRFVTYKVVDPSFHNWTGLAMALRSESISDFPICNKSFNLSYCGHDL
ncbi:MAG: hydrogenase [Planctomycetes bacterium]|nr:hydrogenase [Planctomycetota bacterium]